MDYQKPFDVTRAMLAAGEAKARLPVKDLLLRGSLSGALLGVPTSLAILATLQTNLLCSQSTTGKIAAAWLPIFTFFAQGFEHSVVNMFLIPTGILLGAKTTLGSWWLWNQVPVTVGNLVGGMVFTGLWLYWTYSVPQPGTKQEVGRLQREMA